MDASVGPRPAVVPSVLAQRPASAPLSQYQPRWGRGAGARVQGARGATAADCEAGPAAGADVPGEAKLREKPNGKRPGKRLSPSSINQALAAVRGVCKAARSMGLMPHDAYTPLSEVEPARGKRVRADRDSDAGGVRSIMSICLSEPGPRGVRDAAIVALFYSTGLRRAELARLSLEDYEPGTGRLRLLGKGDRERLTYLDEGAAEWLADWLRLRGDGPGPLFVPIDRDGKLLWRHMTAEAVYNVIRTRARRAGLERPTPHDFRRTVIVICTKCGHENVVDRRGIEDRLGR